MARIDAGNDDLMRYVVRRYAYDPQRRERRHQIAAAFDDEREWGAFLDQPLPSWDRTEPLACH